MIPEAKHAHCIKCHPGQTGIGYLNNTQCSFFRKQNDVCHVGSMKQTHSLISNAMGELSKIVTALHRVASIDIYIYIYIYTYTYVARWRDGSAFFSLGSLLQACSTMAMVQDNDTLSQGQMIATAGVALTCDAQHPHSAGSSEQRALTRSRSSLLETGAQLLPCRNTSLSCAP